jgi:hypothetical protein
MLQGVDQTLPTQETLKVDHVTLDGSASNGIVLQDGAGFAAGSTDLTIKHSAHYPMNIWARAVDRLPTGDYKGNTIDEILVEVDHAYSNVADSATLHERGVPYHVGVDTGGGSLRVDAPSPNPIPTLTIEAGTVLRFKKGGGIMVTASQGTNPATGILVAKGTVDKPIVFTSAEATPAPGDWLGIWYGEIPSASNALDHVVVEYAGGTSSSGSGSCLIAPATNNDAAIRVFGEVSSFVTNSTISHSPNNGIDRGFRSDTKPSFLATNTFIDVARCNETYPGDASGACPAQGSIPCPK